MDKTLVLVFFIHGLSIGPSVDSTVISMCQTAYDTQHTDTFSGCQISDWSGGGTAYPMRIGYVNFPPYIYQKENGDTDGIFYSMFKNYIEKVCRAYNRGFRWIKVDATKTSELLRKCATDNCYFSLANIASSFTSKLASVPISKFHSVPGIAFVTLQVDQEGKILDSIFGTLKNVWPLFLVSMMAGFLAGVVVWLLERWKNAEDFPKPFVHGTYEAFWWSFISMTTVGYGDKAPISVFARLFSVFWILIGIALIGLITSILSTSLTEATSAPLRKMTGLTVGCIDISPIAKTVILDYGGHPRCYTNIVELERDMALGYVHGIAMDSLELQYYTKQRFSDLGIDFFVYQETYTATQMYVMGHFNLPSGSSSTFSDETFQKCSVAFAEHNSEDQKIMESDFRAQYQSLLDNSILADDGTLDGVTILDPESAGVQAMLLWLGFVIFLVILCGLAFDLYHYMREKRLKSNKGYEESEAEAERNMQTREEKFISDAIERTLASTEEKIEVTRKSLRHEIQELSREIRNEMKKGRINPVFDRDKPPTYQKFPIPYSNSTFIHNNNLNNLQKNPQKLSGTKNLAYQY